jgi:hypothetical protein
MLGCGRLELCSESSIQHRYHTLMGSEVPRREMRELIDSGARLIHWVRFASALKWALAVKQRLSKCCNLVPSQISSEVCFRTGTKGNFGG